MKNRLIYQSQLLYTGPTGANSCTGKLSQGAIYGNPVSWTSGANFISELYRVQSINHSWNKQLQDVFQFGELGRIDAVSITPPTVSLSYNYLLSNLINEKLLGLTVNTSGDANQVSCLSGILNATTDSKNYFLKIGAEGNDLIDSNPATYDVISFGNSYLSSYTSQGAVGQLPTVDIAVSCLNTQAQTVTQSVGAVSPAVFPSDGTSVTGHGYTLPTGITSYNNAGINTTNSSISVLRPGDITLNLGLNAGDGFASESDIKIQNYNISFNLNQEDLQKLGTKYAYAKVPQVPIKATMTVSALLGEIQTGSLVEIVNNNISFSPSVTIKKPGDSTTTVAYYQLRGAKLDSQDFSSSIGANSTVNLTFTSTISGPQDSANGLFISGQTIL